MRLGASRAAAQKVARLIFGRYAAPFQIRQVTMAVAWGIFGVDDNAIDDIYVRRSGFSRGPLRFHS